MGRGRGWGNSVSREGYKVVYGVRMGGSNMVGNRDVHIGGH